MGHQDMPAQKAESNTHTEEGVESILSIDEINELQDPLEEFFNAIRINNFNVSLKDISYDPRLLQAFHIRAGATILDLMISVGLHGEDGESVEKIADRVENVARLVDELLNHGAAFHYGRKGMSGDDLTFLRSSDKARRASEVYLFDTESTSMVCVPYETWISLAKDMHKGNESVLKTINNVEMSLQRSVQQAEGQQAEGQQQAGCYTALLSCIAQCFGRGQQQDNSRA